MKAYYKVDNVNDMLGYMDLDNYEKHKIEYHLLAGLSIFIEKKWFDDITIEMKSGEYQPSYNELAIWTKQFDDYVFHNNMELSEEQHQILFNEYVEQRRTLQSRTIEEFMKNNNNR